jgi:hypothetical protein
MKYISASYSFSGEVFTNFDWYIPRIFNDRAQGHTRIEIRFKYDGQPKSRSITTSDLSHDTAVAALAYAVAELDGQAIGGGQDPASIEVGEFTLKERGALWRAQGLEWIDEFNAQSSGLDRPQSRQVLAHLDEVRGALLSGALGAAVEALQALPASPLFPDAAKAFWINEIETYLSRWP